MKDKHRHVSKKRQQRAWAKDRGELPKQPSHKRPGKGRKRLTDFFVRVLSACGNVIDVIPVHGHRAAFDALIALRREGARVRLFAHDDRGRLYRSRVC